MVPARARGVLDGLLDPLLAAALLASGLSEVWIESGQVAGSRVLNTVFVLLTTVPIAVRRQRPLAVLAVVALASSGWNYAFYLADQPPLTPFLALLLAAFAVAATAARGSAVAGAALVAFWVVSTIPALAGGVAAGDIVPAWIFAALAWALGRVVHRQRALAAALADRAAQLEREREEKARLAVALERARLARELHDVVTHNVSVMVVQAGVERRGLGAESEPTREVLGSIEEIGRATLVELRRLLGVLRKDDALPLAPQPTLERLSDLVEQSEEAGVPVELRIEGARARLPAGIELSAYRIVQEALTNVLKHAGPARATVVVRYEDEALELEIADDGRSPGANEVGAGHGLIGMRERVALHGGTVEAARRGGDGFIVRARLPLTGS